MLTDEDLLEIDATLAVKDFRAGRLREGELYSALRRLGFTNSEISRRLEAAQSEAA